MRKIFIIFVIFIFSINLSTFACDKISTDKTGRWAEKISERVVMDIYQDKDGKEYSIFITWREDNLAQKDIYRFKAKFNLKGELEYKNGIHIYRYYDSRNKYEDKIDYIDGKGTFNMRDNEITWTDFKDNNSIVFIPENKDLIKERNKNRKKTYNKDYIKTQIGRAWNLISAYNQSDKKHNRGRGNLTAQWIVENIFSSKCKCGETDWHKLGCNRVNNDLPHTTDNVVCCCTECNKKLPRKK